MNDAKFDFVLLHYNYLCSMGWTPKNSNCFTHIRDGDRKEFTMEEALAIQKQFDEDYRKKTSLYF